ncbi:MAG: hypothetical protein HGB32_13730 [Geobacteraceae bacterium]|nr:hypothetical protein [Geobacteraceae bacterium]NTW81186.1 hypothetical protein [Geobacteraceae bacterium]
MKTNSAGNSFWQRFISITVGITICAVMAFALCGCSSDSATPVTATPKAVLATPVDTGTTLVTWEAVPGATSYTLYCSTDPNATPETATKITGITDTSYTCTGLDYLKTYYYKVTALSPLGESSLSEECCCSLPPVSPESVSVTAGNDGSLFIDIGWSPVASSANCPITYNIYKSTTTPVPLVAPFVANVTSPYRDREVADVTRYYYAVTSKGPGGESKASAEAGAMAVIPPGAPLNVSVIRTPEVTLSATINWTAPNSGGAPDTYEIYRSATADAVGDKIATIPAGTYQYIDNSGLLGNTTYYWTVSAKRSDLETHASSVSLKVIGPPNGGSGDSGFGNNFAAALVFADGIGISGETITGAWTLTSPFDYLTGLRPLSTETVVTALPYFDDRTIYLLNDVTYYKQQTASTWQGEWLNGAGTEQRVTAKWGDNLVSQSLTENSVIRIEMVLSKALTTPMKAYTMKSLYGAKENEMVGTDGTTYDALTAFVFASNAHLKIQKLDGDNNPVGAPLYDQVLWTGDGPGFLAGEVNVSGNFTYGFVWTLNKQVLPGDIPTKTGKWRLTFSLDPTSPKGTANNTFIDTAANGVLVSPAEVYIDININ